MCSSVEQYFVDVIFYSWQKGDNERMRQKSESRSSRRSWQKYGFGITKFLSQVKQSFIYRGFKELKSRFALLYDCHVNATGKNFVTNVYCFCLVHLQFNNCNSKLLQKLHENNKQKGSTINNEWNHS